MTLTVQIPPGQIDRAKELLNGINNGYTRAVVRAANYASDRTKTEITRKLKALLTVDPDTIKYSLRQTRAVTVDPSARLTINPSGGSVRLFLYDWSAQIPTTQGGVTVKIFKTGAPLILKHAFIARMQSGHTGVFMRQGPKRKMGRGAYAGKMRQPIVEKFGPHLSKIFEDTPGLEAEILVFGLEKFNQEFLRQVDFLLAQSQGNDPPDGG